MGVILLDNFTGTNGDAPNTSVWDVAVDAGCTAQIQSNKLRLSLASTQFNSAYVTTDNNVGSANVDITFSVTINGVTADAITEFHFRWQSSTVGYVMEIGHFSGNWGISSVSDYSQFMSGAHGGTSGDTVNVRIQAIGSALKVKVWLNGAGEPGSWTQEATNSAHSADGKLRIGIYNNAATTGYTDVEFVQVDDTLVGHPSGKRMGGVAFGSFGSSAVRRW